MGYFDSLIDFKTNTDGKTIYYPNSFWGKGYIVPSLEKKNEIQRAAKRIWKLFLFLLFVGVAGSGISITLLSSRWWLTFGAFLFLLLVGLTIWCQRSLQRLANGLAPSNVKITLLESYTNSALSMSFLSLLFLEMVSWLGVFTGLQIAGNPQYLPWLFRPVGILAVTFFGLASIAFLYMIAVKITTTLRK